MSIVTLIFEYKQGETETERERGGRKISLTLEGGNKTTNVFDSG